MNARRLSPLREWEVTRKIHAVTVAAVYHAPTPVYLAIALAAHTEAHRALVAARVRLALSALAYLVVAAGIIGIVYGLIVLLWAAFGADPAAPTITDIQLPTL